MTTTKRMFMEQAQYLQELVAAGGLVAAPARRKYEQLQGEARVYGIAIADLPKAQTAATPKASKARPNAKRVPQVPTTRGRR